MTFALALPATIVRASLLIAAPALAVALTVQIALAAAGRVVPRFGSFTLTFPIVFATAAIVTIVTIPLFRAVGRRSVARHAVSLRAAEPLSDDVADKRYDATPSRKERAKREGNVARSSELASLASFGGALATLALVLPALC